MRERQRRAMTTKIFHGLRKHGGYQHSRRANINQVLRELSSPWRLVGSLRLTEPPTTRSAAFVRRPCQACEPLPNLWLYFKLEHFDNSGRCTLITPASSTIATGGAAECSSTTSPHSNGLDFFPYNNNDESNRKLGTTFLTDGHTSGGIQESDSLHLPVYMHNGAIHRHILCGDL